MARLTLNPSEKRRLERALRQTSDARHFRRLLAVLEVGQGCSVSDIARLLHVGRRSVYRWIEAYIREANPAGLADAPRSGRPGVLDDEAIEELARAVERSPIDLGYYLGSDRDTYSLRTLIEKKKSAILKRLRHLDPRDVILCEDETDLRLFPPLRAAWIPRGKPGRIVVSGRNAKRVVFGSINIRTGTRLFLVTTKQTATDFEMYLRFVRRHYRGWRVVMLIDSDPSHKAASSKQAAKNLGIELLELPLRSPELNPMEALWGDAKDNVCSNRQYKSIEDQAHRFITYLELLPDTEALTKSGLKSDDFWLKI